MVARRLRVAHLGVGGMARAHLQAARASNRAEVVGLCDIAPAALDEARGDEAVPCFQDYAAMLDAVRPEATVLSLPHDLYPAAVAEAARRGIAILKEKPFARNLTDALDMHQAVTAAGVPFLCAAQRKFTRPFELAREMVADGRVGDIFLTRALITYPWRIGGDWGWRAIRSRSGGIAILDSGWHALDALVWLKGRPSSVYARIGAMQAAPGSYDVDDKGVLTFDFADGSIGCLVASHVTAPSRFELCLHGTAATLELTADRLFIHPRSGGQPEVVEADGRQPVAAQFEHFVDVVTDGVTPATGIETALQIQRVVEAAYESAATGRAVDLPD